ncbi:Hsp20/alpha crystallin family protein [Methanohalophilus sp.]|uniref:Hsp20/alpha crystallin family protein n=1 Tax=Methanohalophilus sp. TaxID=1966352 RepID=UPI00263044FE|nr:Hsp20/alpha crystallin family protein [Methanohalophilus sp.]MDK2892401.1 hypothetical protein [Methanohalophilus sp.]
MVDKSESGSDKSQDKDPLQDFSEIIEQMMNKLGIDLGDLSGESFVYGFSITNLSGEDPEIRELGNTSYEHDLRDGPYIDVQANKCKPLIEINEIDNNIYVTAELPGVEKEDIRLSVTDTLVKIDATRGVNEYSETVILPAKVSPESAKASYRNGVLEIVLLRVAELLRFDVTID